MAKPNTTPLPETSLIRSLTLADATSLVIGTVIGTGIFIKSSTMAATLGSPLWVMVAWVFAGLLSLAGALTYAELGSRYPKAGGEFVYLREAYGDFTAFLYGWTRFFIGSPGSIAAYGVGAATFLSGVISLESFPFGRTGCAIALITFFSAINLLKVSTSGLVQTALTIIKYFVVIALSIGLLFFAAPATQDPFSLFTSSPLSDPSNQSFHLSSFLSAFFTASIAALWAYDGWNGMPMVAGEIHEPKKNIPRALFLGMSLVLVAYLLVNFGYFRAIDWQTILSSNPSKNAAALSLGAVGAKAFFGDFGIRLISIAMVISALGAMNGSIMAGARIPYAMAVEGLAWKKLAHLSRRTSSPQIAVISQFVVSVLLAMSGTFDQLTDQVVFASWIFYALCAGALFIFRRRSVPEKDLYQAWGYPFVPILFIVLSVLLLGNTLITQTHDSLIGLLMIAAGAPVFWWMKRKPN